MAKIINMGSLAGAISRYSQRLYTAPQTTIQDARSNSWPSPSQPVTPIGPPGSMPLGAPYWFGYNQTYTPRPDARATASELQELSRYPLARICVENTKDQLCQLPWKIERKVMPGESPADVKARRKATRGDEILVSLSRMLEYPDGHNNWQEFIRPVLEDMLVLDAPSIELMRTRKGKLVGLAWIPGDDICRYVDDAGRTPLSPSPAYAQLYQGVPRVNLTVDQLVYRPRNISPLKNNISSYLYGFSPTEQTSPEIQIGIGRLLYVKAFYEKGSLGNVIQVVPPGVTPDKIKEANDWVNSMLSGNLDQRRMWTMIQGFQEDPKGDQIIIPKEPTLADNFDDLHIRKICFAFGTSPSRLQRAMNRGSASVSQQAAQEEGIKPWITWLRGVMNYIIQVQLGYYDYEIDFNLYQDLDSVKQAKANASDIDHGILSPNDCRVARGEDPDPNPNADKLWFKTPVGYVPVEDAEKVFEQAKDRTSGGGDPNPPKGDEAGKKPVSPNPPPAKVNGHAASVSTGRLVIRGEM